MGVNERPSRRILSPIPLPLSRHHYFHENGEYVFFIEDMYLIKNALQ